MDTIKFAKYNRSRKKEFQISTTIYSNETGCFVKKAALTDEAKAHIARFKDKYESLEGEFENVSILKCTYKDDAAIFPFVEGKTVSELLLNSLDCKETLVENIQYQIDYLFDINKTDLVPFVQDPRFSIVFGDDRAIKGPALKVSNIDMIFDNIIVSDGKYVCLDYEWVMDFSVPLEYIIYRSIHYFYVKHNEKLKNVISEYELYTLYGMSKEAICAYEYMEKNFQTWVFGSENEYKYTDKYEKQFYDIKELLDYPAKMARIVALKNEVEDRNKHISVLDQQIENLGKEYERVCDLSKKDREFREQFSPKIEGYEEKLRLLHDDLERKDVHIRNIEAELFDKNSQLDNFKIAIEDKDRHISNIQPVYDRWIYKQQHGHFIKRGIKKVGTIVLPKNSERRRWTIAVLKSITKKSICPSIFPYGKWGYVHIGDVYNEIGPIEFKPVEKPLVSIIVPCYNQVDYTYRCLKSIYDNTKDISYEVILADDVSSDGTKNIGKYIKNINIIRNQKNLKFLLNCNNAAKSAKGEYILFLNNDTKVMENWLSPLVELIESKEDVGMVGSKLIYPDGRLQEAGGIIWRDKGGWNFGNGQDAELPEFNYVRETDYISGAAIMIKKSLWGDIGGFDETFAPAYCEDTDLAFEVRKHGYKVLYQPQSVVVHYEGISNGTDLTTGIKKYQVVNEEKFRSKWSEEMSKHYDNGQNPFCARERNFGDKKVVLFIDHYVPHFDKDAGSRTVFQYICLFLQKGYIVKFIGDNYFKHEPYTTMLNQLGVEVLHGPWYANNIDKWFDENMKYINYVFTNRPHISVKYIDKLREFPNVRIMYYGHDLHFMRMEREYEITGEPLLLTESKEWKNKELSIMRNVDVVYYLSTLEKTVINDIDPSINVKNIMVNVFEKFQTNINYDFSKRNGILFVGGFAHTPNIDAILWFVNNVFPKILDKKKIKLFVVGSHAPQEVLDLANEDIIVKGFVSDEELQLLYNQCKLSVVPLRYGAGVKGKVIEALYNGIPIVTTSIGAEGIIDIEKLVAIDDEEQAFADDVLSLYEDNDTLKQMAENSQIYIKQRYSVDAAWSIIEEDFS